MPENRPRGDRRDLNQFTEGWDKAAAELGIGWPIKYEVRDDIDTCKITSSPDEQEHEVWIQPNVLAHPELFEVDVMHELCHAKISENIDPAFSTIRFSKAASKNWGGEQAAEFRRKANQLYLAWAHVDIWINDLRHQHWPNLTKKDIISFYDSVRGLIKQRASQPLTDPRNIIAIALNAAEARRHLGRRARPDPQPILNAYDRQARMLIKEIEEYLKNLPPLSGDRAKDLSLLEQSVQTMAKILKLSISPRLVEEDGKMVWEV